MNAERISELLEKLIVGTISLSEKGELNAWYNEYNQSNLVEGADMHVLDKREKKKLRRKIYKTLLKQINGKAPGKVLPFYPKQTFIRKIAVAAVFLIVAAGGLLVYNDIRVKKPSVYVSKDISKQEITPGHNGATLHLSNGKTIDLDTAKDGVIADQNGVQIVKKNGKLNYVGKADDVIYNDIVTSRGQQWQLELSDGTKVWLNAASSIHYPLSFKGKERIVKITGEAYFEVVHNKAQPFKIQVGNIQIEDIGTELNVNAYTDEPSLKTTLINGSIKVSTANETRFLTPGQQAITLKDNNSIEVKKEVNVDEVISWKNGQIQFENESLQTIMRQISRWYDVDITYDGDIPRKIFTGAISKKSDLSELLKILKFEGVHFTLEGRTIVVKP
ncbi:MAG: FecR family protein [Ginsengibacter sp.]